MQIGLYIHIPFCASKCYYCDFLSFPCHEDQEAYIEALIREMKETSKALAHGTTIKSIFIGGGTPTVLPPFLLDKLCSAINHYFKLEKMTEWTIEANPGTLDHEKIEALNKYPITRISLGLQSTHDDLLKKIGRIHKFKEWEENIKLLRQLTSWHINTDLMFALPGQTLEAFKETLETITSYHLEHLSIYALIIEEGTTFGDLYNEGKFMEVPEELDRQMYHMAKDYLAEQGYTHYEISNWARPGHECVHNKVYWQLENYIGLGLGAHGLINNERYFNETNIQKYIAAQGDLNKIRLPESYLTKEMEMEEYMFLGLRLLEGISISEFEKRFNKGIWDTYGSIIKKWIKYNVLVQDNDRIYLSAYGLDVCNEVFASFL